MTNLILLVFSFIKLYAMLYGEVGKPGEVVAPDFTPITFEVNIWAVIGFLFVIIGLFLKLKNSKIAYYIILIINILYLIKLSLVLMSINELKMFILGNGFTKS